MTQRLCKDKHGRFRDGAIGRFSHGIGLSALTVGTHFPLQGSRKIRGQRSLGEVTSHPSRLHTDPFLPCAQCAPQHCRRHPVSIMQMELSTVVHYIKIIYISYMVKLFLATQCVPE